MRKEHGVTSTLNESPVNLKHPDPMRFYRIRQRASLGLLIFVVVVGLPIVGVPSLRHRLSARVMALKTALSGEIRPATIEVGSNHVPFPAEYENPISPVPRAPELPQVQNPKMFSPKSSTVPSRQRSAGVTYEKILLPPEKKAETAEQPLEQTASSAESELKYQKGQAEQEAYQLLLQSNPKVAEMVQGSNPSLKFKSWDAANRGEDTYWVRMKFQSEENPDEEYIWQVKVQSKEVTPLSYKARSIS
jgi:hypothetical protein